MCNLRALIMHLYELIMGKLTHHALLVRIGQIVAHDGKASLKDAGEPASLLLDRFARLVVLKLIHLNMI